MKVYSKGQSLIHNAIMPKGLAFWLKHLYLGFVKSLMKRPLSNCYIMFFLIASAHTYLVKLY